MIKIIDEAPHKYCTKCGEWKPAGEFYRSKNKKDGMHLYCKECEKEYLKKYRKNNKDKIKEYNKEYHINYYEKNKEQLKEYRKKYYYENKERKKEHRKKYYEKNKDKLKEYGKKYRENNKDKLKECTKEYYKNNKDKIKEYSKEYRQTEKGKIVAKNANHRRRMRIKTTPERHRITAREWNQILYEYNNICPRCGCKFDDDNPATMDHIKPLSKGGEHVYDNIQPLCHSCNSAKGVREIRYPVPDYHPKPDVDTFITI